MQHFAQFLAAATLVALPVVCQTTTRDSLSFAGVQDPNWGADIPVISQNGRFVVFQSAGPNLVPGDTNNAPDIFCHDRQTATTTRVSVGAKARRRW